MVTLNPGWVGSRCVALRQPNLVTGLGSAKAMHPCKKKQIYLCLGAFWFASVLLGLNAFGRRILLSTSIHTNYQGSSVALCIKGGGFMVRPTLESEVSFGVDGDTWGKNLLTNWPCHLCKVKWLAETNVSGFTFSSAELNRSPCC